MKKVVYALAALSMVALMGLTSCSKNEPMTGLYNDVMVLGKYIGMNLATVKTQVVSAGWTITNEKSDQFIAEKQVDEHAVEAAFSAAENACDFINATIIDDEALANGTTVYNEVGMTYKFETKNKTADWNAGYGELETSHPDFTSYSDGQTWLKEHATDADGFTSIWMTSEEWPVSLILEANQVDQTISVRFMEGI